MTNLSELLGIAFIAFTGSFGHCLGMCGGLVMAYSSTKIDSFSTKFSQLIKHTYYHIGRVFIYACFGALAGLLASSISINIYFSSSIQIFAGVVMVLTALAMLGISKALLSIEYSLQKYSWFKKSFAFLIKSNSSISFFALGALNGLFPCGFVYFFLAKAAISGGFINGFLTMAVFGLATIPALMILASSASFLKNIEFRAIMNKMAAFVIILFGVFTIYRAVAALV